MAVVSAKRLAKYWFLTAVVLAILWALLSLNVKEHYEPKSAILSTSKTLSEQELPKTIDTLGDFSSEVPSVSFDAITKDLRQYGKQFKDKTFFEQYEQKWTVQVMDVEQYQLISDYLELRKDQDKFAYFRYTDADNKERYILTYGVMSNFQEALGATKLIDFKLSTRVIPEKIAYYLSLIDDYARPEVQELAAKPVALKEAKKEIKAKPVKTQKPVAPTQSSNSEDDVQPKPALPKVTADTSELATPPTAKPIKSTKITQADEGQVTQTMSEDTQAASKKESSKKESTAKDKQSPKDGVKDKKDKAEKPKDKTKDAATKDAATKDTQRIHIQKFEPIPADKVVTLESEGGGQ